MRTDSKNVLLISMPFAGVHIPSIQLELLEPYLLEREIKIETRHLYLSAADIYKNKNYFFMIEPPNDSYTAQIIYSKYVYPEHYNQYRDKIKENLYQKSENSKKFNFNEYEKKTDVFYSWIFKNINFLDFDLIGFSLNYGQLLPSLAVAKKIKEQYPKKKIIFGGSRTVGELGIIALKTHPYIDYIVSGDGEEPLYQLALESKLDTIPGLIYRKENKICFNPSQYIDMNTLPIPNYNSFYRDLLRASSDIQQFFSYQGRIPIEISRGCWWNKCTFCNLNLQHKKYREKSVEKIIDELNILSEEYRNLSFQIIGNTLPIRSYRNLCKSIINLKKDFNFFVETRADQLRSEDYYLLKQAGFIDIQTGIESFSKSYLKKMNKGARVIDNIAALKYCKENQIKNHYNLIINYPNEDKKDFEESKKTILALQSYLDPPQICQLRVMYGSIIHCNPNNYNIEKLEPTTIDTLMFPKEILSKGFVFVFGFKRKQIENNENNWEELINNWQKQKEKQELKRIKDPSILKKFVFYFEDGKNFIKIFDNRNSENINIFLLNEIERKIFLSCIDIASYNELKIQFPNLFEEKLKNILQSFVENGILFEEDDYYLALPIRTNVNKYYKEEFEKIYDNKLVECSQFK
ncbi:MAG: RiPP maturation radical SAM C-methyltransferase [Thermoplasmatales archaeon]|nr:MAG: RiPP maturation radical SAM C-methyltransferase [Thermoplasmatales archaeon]